VCSSYKKKPRAKTYRPKRKRFYRLRNKRRR